MNHTRRYAVRPLEWGASTPWGVAYQKWVTRSSNWKDTRRQAGDSGFDSPAYVAHQKWAPEMPVTVRPDALVVSVAQDGEPGEPFLFPIEHNASSEGAKAGHTLGPSLAPFTT